ncbi:hypothetical protein EDB80DRAFT_738042 [Ilyonectria destructans]|nr:hypothetical protein EDB80DRAFT_738042 [Ilyonectria destructans]
MLELSLLRALFYQLKTSLYLLLTPSLASGLVKMSAGLCGRKSDFFGYQRHFVLAVQRHMDCLLLLAVTRGG